MTAVTLDDVRGHLDSLALLSRSVAQDRVPHAMLFRGPEGIGKRTTALALARRLVCGDDPDELARFDRGAHDRFVLYQDLSRPLAVPRSALLPLVGSEEALLAEYETLAAAGWIGGVSACRGENVVDLLVRNPEKFTGRKGIPFAAVLEKELTALAASRKSSALTVEVARTLFSPGTSRVPYRRNLGIELINGKGDGAYFRTVDALLARSAGANWRVVILDDAHRLTEAAENAFLKTLEEPPPCTLLVLVTSEPMSLLPTTVSRCAHVRFDSLPAELVASYLTETQGVSAEDAALLASLSEGSVGKALVLRDTDFTAQRKFVERLLVPIAAGDLGECLGRAGEHLAGAEVGARDNVRDVQRNRARGLLELLALCFRDLTLAAAGADCPSRAGLEATFVRKLAARRAAEEWERLFHAAERALDDVERSVEPRLAIEGLFVDALPEMLSS